MARPISTNLIPSIRWPKGLIPEVAPKQLDYFYPPKGIDVVTPLDRLPREFSPLITNLVLDRGVLRSRFGVETYHNNDAGTQIQLTVDLTSTVTPTNPAITARTTANQGTAAGWTDPDGVSNGVNSASVTDGATQVAAANRLWNFIGDPTTDTNVLSYNGTYVVTFRISASNTYTAAFANSLAYVDIEASTDGGVTYSTVVSRAGQVNVGKGGSSTQLFTTNVTLGGQPAHVKFRLALTVSGVQAGGSGSASGSVLVFSTAWLTDTYPITWFTSVAPIGALAARLPTRWTGTHMQMYTDPTDASATWTTVYTFPNTQINSDFTLPSYVTWAGTVISTDIGNSVVGGAGNPIGSRGLISTLLVTPFTTAILTHSPRAAHIAVFGNRIVASRTNDWTAPSDPQVTVATNLSRVRWSVKNNSNDWDGVGSGFEDLVIPGGVTDEVMGVFPVSDQTAIVISERSIRRMDVTGFVDAPFIFGLLTQSIGTQSRYSIKQIPGGVIFISYDDAIIFTLEGAKRIGSSALRDSLRQITNPRLASGYYDQYNSRYLVALKEGNIQVVWSYSFLDGGWTRLNLPFDIVSIDRAYLQTVGGVLTYTLYLTQAATSGFSCRENPVRSKDVTVAGADTDSSLEIRTGLIKLDPLRKVELVEAQLVYESTVAQTLTFEYSTDSGATWLAYSTASIVATSGPTVLSVRKDIEATKLQIRVTSSTLGGLKLISLSAFAKPGAMIRA